MSDSIVSIVHQLLLARFKFDLRVLESIAQAGSTC